MRISTAAPLVILSIIALFGCNPSSENPEVVDYATLEELPVEMVMEIGESESYLPGRILDLEVMEDGTMFARDRGSVTIEQFNNEGEHVGTVARAGQGPGELDDSFSIYALGDDTLISRDFSTKKNYYARSEGELFEHVDTKIRPESFDRYFSSVIPISQNEFYAVEGVVTNNPVLAEREKKAYTEIALALVDAEENVLEDSLHILKKSRGLIVRTDRTYTATSVPYRSIDRFVPLQDGNYLIARPDSSAFFVYNRDHELERRIPFRVKERPVTEDDLEFALGESSGKIRREVEDATPDVKPPFQNLYASENYLWLLTDESDAGKEMVVVDFEGTPVGKFMLSENDEIEHVGG